jgi:hypothetical protein
MNAQEIFDKIVLHLRTQNAKSVIYELGNRTPICVYRNPNNLKCAAGCLIEDNEYRKDMEGKTFGGLIDEGFFIKYKTYRSLITLLQNLHDYEQIIDWEVGFELIAEEYNLIYSKL